MIRKILVFSICAGLASLASSAVATDVPTTSWSSLATPPASRFPLVRCSLTTASSLRPGFRVSGLRATAHSPKTADELIYHPTTFAGRRLRQLPLSRERRERHRRCDRLLGRRPPCAPRARPTDAEVPLRDAGGWLPGDPPQIVQVGQNDHELVLSYEPSGPTVVHTEFFGDGSPAGGHAAMALDPGGLPFIPPGTWPGPLQLPIGAEVLLAQGTDDDGTSLFEILILQTDAGLRLRAQGFSARCALSPDCWISTGEVSDLGYPASRIPRLVALDRGGLSRRRAHPAGGRRGGGHRF